MLIRRNVATVISKPSRHFSIFSNKVAVLLFTAMTSYFLIFLLRFTWLSHHLYQDLNNFLNQYQTFGDWQ